MTAVNGVPHKTKTLQGRIVSGSAILLAGSGLTTALNLVYNLEVARFLGPKGFGQATVVYTILTLISAVTLSFQIIPAKVVAQQGTQENKAAVYRGFHQGAWACGILVAVILLVFQNAIASYLNLPSPVLVALLAIGAAFYVPLGSRRGFVQGTFGFRLLAVNLIVEGACRLCGSLLLIVLGLGVEGVIAANAAAIGIAYLTLAPGLQGKLPNPLRSSHAFQEIGHAMVFFAGQVIINNCDIVLVKHFFSARDAGIYAAVAMVGRVIWAFTSSVVNSMFPLVASTHQDEIKSLKVIATPLLLVLGTGSALAIVLSCAPTTAWTTFLGPGFEVAGRYDLGYLLALYAITTIVYSLSAVIITFEMSYKIAKTSWWQLVFSGTVILAICRFHSSLREVIVVQLVLMTVLLVSVAFPLLLGWLETRSLSKQAGAFRPLRLIRRVSEDEVIAEFLKSDFHVPAFRAYRQAFQKVVARPDLLDVEENAIRRALLYLRHLALWEELPAGTEWYEFEIGETNLGQIQVFPRAQWRKLAQGSFSIKHIAEAVFTRRHVVDDAFLNKIADISDQVLEDDPALGTVILIGKNESEPLTILDGNHRVVAAMLSSPANLMKIRFLCGLSPRMTECCWYRTNFATLFHYARNMLAHTIRDPETELVRLLEQRNHRARIASPGSAPIASESNP